jgi:endonuclease-3
VSLRGVARKTANVVLGNAFGVPGLAIDTHMKRVHQRLGLTTHDDPDKIERDLQALVPEAEWTQYTHRVIHHGRVCCDAKRPRCDDCPLRDDCPWPRQQLGAGRPGGAKARRQGATASPRKAKARKGRAPRKGARK